jgi:NAD-dependent dihydropyrimidine dehydrogenase PreA subunit
MTILESVMQKSAKKSYFCILNAVNMNSHKINRRQWLTKMATLAGAAVTAPLLLRATDTDKCIDCGYCMPCGYGVDIPAVLRFHAEAEKSGLLPDDTLDASSPRYREVAKRHLSKYDRTIKHNHQAHRCIRCWHCVGTCPNNIFIVKELEAITAATDKMRDSLCYE